jgi:hypothetical protein
MSEYHDSCVQPATSWAYNGCTQAPWALFCKWAYASIANQLCRQPHTVLKHRANSHVAITRPGRKDE